MTDQNDLVPQLPEDIPEGLREVFEKIGDDREVLKSLAIYEGFAGPIPHPRIVKEYAAILPDAPERIFNMAESQQDHRIGLEKDVVKGDIWRANAGLILGFILFLIFGVGSIVLLAMGKDMQGYALLGTSLLGGVGNFIRVGRERIKTTKEPASSITPQKVTSDKEEKSSQKKDNKGKKKK